MRILIDATYACRAPYSGTAVYFDRLAQYERLLTAAYEAARPGARPESLLEHDAAVAG